MDGRAWPAYRHVMVRDGFRIKTIALVAAYAVALQGLFGAFLPIAEASPFAVLCSSREAGTPAMPAGHEPSCVSACAMLGGVEAAPRPAGDAVAAPLAIAAFAPIPLRGPPHAAPRGPQAARAPPLA